MAASVAGSQALMGRVGAAAPTTQDPVIKVNFQINWQQSWNAEAIKLTQQYTDAQFNSRHKGVRAIPQSWGNASGILAQVLAGDATAPAVVSSCCGDFAIALPMLARLDPLLRQNNLPESLWSAGQLITYQEPDGLYGVPAYTACQPLIYNQSLFDELGLTYPDPSWDYAEATRIWRQLAGTNGSRQHRYATTMQWYPNNFDGGAYLLKGFGGEYMDATHTRCLLDSKGSLAAGSWIYPMIWDKVIINRFGISGYNGAGAIVAGLTGMYQSAGNMLFEAVAEIGTKLKWDVLPMPAWPVRRGTNVQVDYYGMNAHYPNQDLAWELFQFVAASQDTNRYLIRTTLSFPNLMSMWDEWEALIRVAAPVTRDKALHWWADAATQGYGYGHEFWKYADPQAASIAGNVMQQIWDQKLSVVGGFTQISRQINALQKAEGVAATEAAVISHGLSEASTGHYPAPAATGVGAAPGAARARARGPRPRRRLTGPRGGGGPAGDGLVWAGSASTAVTADFVCRLDGLQNVNSPHLSQWSAAGLMVRNDLSDNAASLLVAVTAGDGLMLQTRPAALEAATQQMGVKGLPAAAALTHYSPSGHGNVLSAPVWLRLTRKGTKWHAFTSADGQSWTPAGAEVDLQMAACWAGVFATANNMSFGGSGQVSAAFSRLSMPATHSVRIGKP